jgi:hypothetical protein
MKHPSKFPQPALLIIVELALKSEEDFGVRAAAAYCFQVIEYCKTKSYIRNKFIHLLGVLSQSFTCNNRDAQIALAATLTPPPIENPNDNDSGLF